MTEQPKKVTWRQVGPIGSWELTPLSPQTTLPEIKYPLKHVWDLGKALRPLKLKKSSSEEALCEKENSRISPKAVQMLVEVLEKQERRSLGREAEYGKSSLLNHWKTPNKADISSDSPLSRFRTHPKLIKPLQFHLKSPSTRPHFPIRSLSTRFSPLPKSFILSHSPSTRHQSSIKLTYRF